MVTQPINCPNCGKTLSKPTRKIENHFFSIEFYNCDKCGTSFKLTH